MEKLEKLLLTEILIAENRVKTQTKTKKSYNFLEKKEKIVKTFKFEDYNLIIKYYKDSLKMFLRY